MSEPFVIHIHSGFGPLHFDLMLRSGPALATWQLSQPPLDLPLNQPQPVKKLPDHRAEYLTYQGPIARGRGQIAFLDKGLFNLIISDEGLWEVELIGEHVRGRFQLRRLIPAGDGWTLTRLA